MRNGADDIHHHIDDDDHRRADHNGSEHHDINHNPAFHDNELADLQQHDDQYGTKYAADYIVNRARGIDYGPQFDDHDHDDESDYVLVRRSDLDNLAVIVYDDTFIGTPAPFDAARTLVDNAVLSVPYNAADRPADNDTAMCAYILERARYDARISDLSDIFGPLRDAARSFLATVAGDSVTS